MSNFTYDPDVPTPSHNPSTDVTTMQVNSQSNGGIWDVDHVGFNTTNGGTHNKATFQEQGSDPSVAADATVLYAKLADSETTLFVRQENNGSSYQLTGKTPFLGVAEGYTFLPGGLLLQFGRNPTGGNTTTVFPAAFTTLYSITLGPETSNTTGMPRITGGSASGFSVLATGGGGYYWMAIGTA